MQKKPWMDINCDHCDKPAAFVYVQMGGHSCREHAAEHEHALLQRSASYEKYTMAEYADMIADRLEDLK